MKSGNRWSACCRKCGEIIAPGEGIARKPPAPLPNRRKTPWGSGFLPARVYYHRNCDPVGAK